MFHIALAIHGRVPRSETVRRIRYMYFFVRFCRNRSDRLTIANSELIHKQFHKIYLARQPSGLTMTQIFL